MYVLSFPSNFAASFLNKKKYESKVIIDVIFSFLEFGSFCFGASPKEASCSCKVYEKVATRIPFIFSVQAEDINDCLYLTFQFSLDDADITMLDKDGNEKV